MKGGIGARKDEEDEEDEQQEEEQQEQQQQQQQQQQRCVFLLSNARLRLPLRGKGAAPPPRALPSLSATHRRWQLSIGTTCVKKSELASN